MYKYLLIIVVLFSYSCNIEKENNQSDKFNLNDPDFTLNISDSLMNINIEYPNIIDSSLMSQLLVDEMTKLAKETGGKPIVVFDTRYIIKIINEIIKKQENNSDIMFIIDNSESMYDDIDNIKIGIDSITNNLKKYNPRLSICLYSDRNYNEKKWISLRNFEKNYSEFKTYLLNIQTNKGGDYNESVYDALAFSLSDKFWRKESTNKIAILIGDAPSHKKPLSKYELEDIIRLSKFKNINVNFYPIILNNDIIENKKINLISGVYPNPSRGSFIIELKDSMHYEVEIFNSNKEKLMHDYFVEKKNYYFLDNYKPGVYFIRVLDKYKNYDTQKIVLLPKIKN